MKRLILASLLVTGTLIASKSNAQVYVNAGVHFGIPAPGVCVTPPRVVYQQPYYVPEYGSRVVVEGPAYGYGRYYYPERRRRYYDEGWRHEERERAFRIAAATSIGTTCFC